MRRSIGIDPGLRGGIAVIDAETKSVKAWPMPIDPDTEGIDILELHRRLVGIPHESTIVTVEKAQAAPKQGVVSMFNYGVGFGIVRAIATLTHECVYMVRPTIWKKALGLSGQPGKESAILLVEQLYPEVNLVLPRCRKPHDGMADAICIAHYGLQNIATF